MSEAAYIRCPCLHCGQHIEFPSSAIGETVQCPQCGHQTMLHRPAAPAIQSAPIVPAPKGAEVGKAAGIRFSRTTTIIATIVVCSLGAVVWRVEIWREREAAVEKTRNALAAELRLLEADLNTGINENDFLRQSARVRAAYDVAKTNLTTSQTERFGEIDLEISSSRCQSSLFTLFAVLRQSLLVETVTFDSS
jgi:DNA-directed RNA polymerase subunit RPC12/RpoP